MEKFKVKISRILKIISFTLILSIVSLLTSIAHANPTITSTTISSNNDVLVVTFSEAVYNQTGASGDLEASDFVLSVASGSATITSSTPTSIAKISQNMWMLGFATSGTADGSEVITVNPASSTSIFNGDDDAASQSQSNNTVNFNSK